MSEVKERQLRVDCYDGANIHLGSKTQFRQIVKPYLDESSFEYCRVVQVGKWFHIEADRPYPVVATYTCPYGEVGDSLWLREAWASVRFEYHYEATYALDDVIDLKGRKPQRSSPGNYLAGSGPRVDRVVYKGDDNFHYDAEERGFQWRSPTQMPRWASRTQLKITDVRLQRLQDISILDAIAEGVCDHEDCKTDTHTTEDHVLCVNQWLKAAKAGDTRDHEAIVAFSKYWDCCRHEEVLRNPKSRNGFGSWDDNPYVWALTFEKQ